MTVQIIGTREMAVSDLHAHPDNPNRGSVEAIQSSLDEFGQYRAVVALKDGTLLAGHHVWKAAQARGDKTIRVEVIDTDPQTAKRILLADNRIAELGDGIDPRKLLELLTEDGFDMAGTGYDPQFLLELEASLADDPIIGDPDSAPKVPKTAGRTKKGQAWRIGKHRVLVGDATDTEQVLAWLGEDRADCVWTDPPYGVDYVGKTKDALTIQNDGAKGLRELMAGMFQTLLAASHPGTPVYIAHGDMQRFELEGEARAAGLLVRQEVVWVKNTMVMGRSDYHYRHEPILVGEVPDDPVSVREHTPILYGFTPPEKGVKGTLGRGGGTKSRGAWYGNNAQTTVFEYDKPAANADHPTMKPVDLIGHMLGNSCPPGGLVLDVFGGSGSTMAAAHVTGRRSALVELDPKYAEVILARYEAMTGDTAVLEV